MPNRFCRTLLFLSSFFPLFLISAILARKHNLFWAVVFIFIGLVSLIALKVYLDFATKKVNPETLRVQSFQRCGEEMLNYILTYIFPFMVDFTQSADQLLCFAIFFVVLGYLFVHNNMIHINPMLNFWGYQLYEITLPNGDTHSLLAKSKLRRDMTIEVVLIGEQIYLEKK